MIPQDLSYDFPSAAYWLLTLPLIILLFWTLFYFREKALKNFFSSSNLKLLLNPRSKSLYIAKMILFSIAWILACLGLMQPKGNGHYPKGQSAKTEEEKHLKKFKSHDIFFLIDASASMAIADSSSQKSRLALAKEIVDEIASDMQGENASLYAFTSIATKMSPPTPDLFFVRMMLRQISINEGEVAGTDIYTSLKTVADKYFKPSTTKLTTLILLSDGGDTKLESASGEDKKNLTTQVLGLIEDPLKLNLRVFTIGMGSRTASEIPHVQYQGKPVFSKLDETLLKPLSEKGRGSFYEANNQIPSDIAKDIFKQMAQDDPYLKESSSQTPPQELLIYQLFFQIPLALALILLTLYILLPDVSFGYIFKTLFIIGCCLNMQALNASSDLLMQARNFFEAGDYQKSASVYDEMLQTNLNNFEKAVVMYNQGTAYLEDKEFQKASDTLELIALSGNPPPFLIRRIKTNLALSKKAESDLLLSSDEQNDLEKAAYLLISAKEEAIAAEKASCELQKLESKPECTTPKDLKELLKEIDENLGELSKKIDLDKLLEGSKDTLHQELGVFSKQMSANYDNVIKQKATNLKELNLIMEKVIEMEHQVLMMTRKLSHVKDLETTTFEILKKAQDQTLKAADHYLNEVYAVQQVLFESSKYQKKPWNEILPLYNKGYQAAVDALNLISAEHLGNLEEASLEEEEAIKYWKEILRKSEDQSPESENTKESNSNRNDQDNKTKALEILQEMQNADGEPAQMIKTLKQEVEKPW